MVSDSHSFIVAVLRISVLFWEKKKEKKTTTRKGAETWGLRWGLNAREPTFRPLHRRRSEGGNGPPH